MRRRHCGEGIGEDLADKVSSYSNNSIAFTILSTMHTDGFWGWNNLRGNMKEITFSKLDDKYYYPAVYNLQSLNSNGTRRP